MSSQTTASLILVVDDEEPVRQSVGGVLSDEGYDVLFASSGPEAIEAARDLKPAVVFLDIWMPGWDGIETLTRIKEVSPDSQVVMMSGHATISTALDASKRGAFDFIEKPLDLEGIVLAARRAVEVSHGLHALEGGGDTVALRPGQVGPLLCNPGVLSTGMPGRNLGQRTLKKSAILYGHCLHSGVKSGLILEPLPRDSGIHFARLGDTKTAPAFIDFVESTGFATTIRSGATVAGTIEHLMAALHSYRISNLLIKCNGEVPIFDGSSLEFCKTIESIGIEEQGGDWLEVAPTETITVSASPDGKETISIEPSDELRVSYELSYPEPVGRQVYTFEFRGPESFRDEIAPCRTFGFMKDIERLQRAGLAAGGRLDNFILIGPDKIVNTELRFPEELCRHKILDAIGDIFLLGRPIRGHIKARMTGHSDNVELLRAIAPHIGATKKPSCEATFKS